MVDLVGVGAVGEKSDQRVVRPKEIKNEELKKTNGSRRCSSLE
jgi:hypothetical protein